MLLPVGPVEAVSTVDVVLMLVLNVCDSIMTQYMQEFLGLGNDGPLTEVVLLPR